MDRSMQPPAEHVHVGAHEGQQGGKSKMDDMHVSLSGNHGARERRQPDLWAPTCNFVCLLLYYY